MSIVVTAHNYRRYVTDCLESLAQQTYRHIEVIVVDDASRDGTATAVRHFRQRMKLPLKHRTVLIALPRNTGYAGAVTTGLFLAKGEFIAMQDMDDISDKTRI